MQPDLTSRIPVRSQRQAMDWSLVLISQGIETFLDHSDPAGGWGLLVSTGDYESALQAIRQFRLENRRWRWRQQISAQGLLFDWACLTWVFLVGFFFWLNTRMDFHSVGVMDSQAVAQGQWWRLFTAVWLHADLAHLASNAALGLVLLGLAMGRYGTGLGLLAAYVAGAGGNVASWLFAAVPHRSLGASGMVMGCLGLLAVQSVATWGRVSQERKSVSVAIAAGLMLFVLLGLSPGTDVLAHFGGFLSGCLLGALLVLLPLATQNPMLNLVGGSLFVVLVIVPWWLASSTLNKS